MDWTALLLQQRLTPVPYLLTASDGELCAPVQKHAKTLAAEEAWRTKYNKEERKKRYVEEGRQDKRAVKRSRMAED